MSVSVPVDFELTGLNVPSTLSSLKSFNGDGGIAVAILLDFVLNTVVSDVVVFVKFGVDVMMVDVLLLFMLSSILCKKNNTLLIVYVIIHCLAPGLTKILKKDKYK